MARVVGGERLPSKIIGGLWGLAAWHAGWLMADGPGSTTDECFPLSFSEQANVCHIHRFSHMGRQQCETFVKCRPHVRFKTQPGSWSVNGSGSSWLADWLVVWLGDSPVDGQGARIDKYFTTYASQVTEDMHV